MRVFLVRHTSVNVPRGMCYGRSDVPVNDTFPQEAAATKERLAGLSFDAVYSSPLTRARLLADFCGYPAPIIDKRLQEIDMGDWEMRMFDEIQDENLRRWYDDFLKVAPTNGESFPELYARVASFLDELKTRPYSSVAIFAHGGVLMCAGVYGGLFTADECVSHLAPYGGVQEITI